MSTSYEKRLHVPVQGNSTARFFTRSNVLVAVGYDRVVIGARGPYVEFSTEHLVSSVLDEVPGQHFYYIELRTSPDNVKVYAQLRKVDYADYLPGKCYISPFDLYDEAGNQLCTPLRKS